MYVPWLQAGIILAVSRRVFVFFIVKFEIPIALQRPCSTSFSMAWKITTILWVLSSAYINPCNSSVRGSGGFHWHEKSNDSKFRSERVFITKSQRMQRLRVTPTVYQWSSLLHAHAFLICEHGTQYWKSPFHSTMHIRVTLTNLQCLSDSCYFVILMTKVRHT